MMAVEGVMQLFQMHYISGTCVSHTSLGFEFLLEVVIDQ